MQPVSYLDTVPVCGMRASVVPGFPNGHVQQYVPVTSVYPCVPVSTSVLTGLGTSVWRIMFVFSDSCNLILILNLSQSYARTANYQMHIKRFLVVW